MPSKIILVTGANGQLGNELRILHERYPQYQFVFAGREELSIDNEEEVRKYFARLHPVVCINCAAYTAVDKAETEREQAKRINADAVGFLAAASHEHNSLFIHISTDYVFDGNSASPYKEDHQTNPVNQYGLTKLFGEKLAMEENPEAIIIRTSWVYSTFGKNFVKTMIRLMNEKESINVVNDQVGSPTYAADLAEAIMQIVLYTSQQTVAGGVFHFSNQGATSWYEFALKIKELIGSNCRVNPIPTSQFPTPATRPNFSLLDTAKIQSTFKLQIVDWKESLQRCISRLEN